MAENNESREHRQVMANAVKDYREALNEDPSKEKDVAREIAERHDVTQKDIREMAEAGV